MRRARRTLLLGVLTLVGVLAAAAAARQGQGASQGKQAAGWESFAVLKGQQGSLWPMAFSPDGKTLAVSGADKGGEIPVVRLWDLGGDTPTVRRTLTGYKNPGGLARVAFSGDGKTLIAVDGEAEVRRWDAASGKALGAFALGNDLRTDAGDLAVWLTTTGKTLAVCPPQRFGGFGQPLPRHVQLWAVETGKLQRSLRLPPDHQAVALSPDGKVLVSAATMLDPALAGADTADVMFLSVATGRLLGRVSTQRVETALYAPTGKMLLIQSSDAGGKQPELLFLDAGAKKARVPRDRALRNSHACGFSGDGKSLVTLSTDRRTVAVWDVNTEPPVGAPARLDSEARGAALSPDGRTLAVADAAGNVRLWTYRGQ
jgi:WD40 repeat protein